MNDSNYQRFFIDLYKKDNKDIFGRCKFEIKNKKLNFSMWIKNISFGIYDLFLVSQDNLVKINSLLVSKTGTADFNISLKADNILDSKINIDNLESVVLSSQDNKFNIILFGEKNKERESLWKKNFLKNNFIDNSNTKKDLIDDKKILNNKNKINIKDKKTSYDKKSNKKNDFKFSDYLDVNLNKNKKNIFEINKMSNHQENKLNLTNNFQETKNTKSIGLDNKQKNFLTKSLLDTKNINDKNYKNKSEWVKVFKDIENSEKLLDKKNNDESKIIIKNIIEEKNNKKNLEEKDNKKSLKKETIKYISNDQSLKKYVIDDLSHKKNSFSDKNDVSFAKRIDVNISKKNYFDINKSISDKDKNKEKNKNKKDFQDKKITNNNNFDIKFDKNLDSKNNISRKILENYNIDYNKLDHDENKFIKEKNDFIQKENYVVNKDTIENHENKDNKINLKDKSNQINNIKFIFDYACKLDDKYKNENAKNNNDNDDDKKTNINWFMISLNELILFDMNYFDLSHNPFFLSNYFKYDHTVVAYCEEKFMIGLPGKYNKRNKLLAKKIGFYYFNNNKIEIDFFEDEFGYWIKEVNFRKEFLF